MPEYRLRFEVELLEDLHAGTGAGRLGLLDDVHARDVCDRPVLWASALRGLLREAGEDWLLAREQAGDGGVEDDRRRLRRLLGATAAEDGSESGRAVVRSLRWQSQPQGQEGHFTVWAATAREAGSRRPLDQTLRFVEYARAGQTFRGEIRLRDGDGGERERAFLAACLRRLQALGGGKTRGWGQLRLKVGDWEKLPGREQANVSGLLAELQGEGPVRLRLRLRNLEPLNLARTAFAGNLIFAQTYLPGGTLRGALLHWLSDHDQTLADRLALPTVMQVGNGYVIPGDRAEGDWAKVEVMPLPLSVREPKGGQGVPTPDNGPWWARAESRDRRLGPDSPRHERDMVARPREPGEEGPDYKRVKTEDYIAGRTNDDFWERFRPSRGVLLRNQVPTARRDGNRPRQGTRPEGFFSEEVLREDQTLLAELWFAGRQHAEEFVRGAANLLGGAAEDRSWLRVGRKGRPVQVEGAAWVKGPAEAKGPADHLTLTLTSDLIARTPWLTFRTELDLSALGDLLREVGLQAPSDEGLVRMEPVSEGTEVYAFNRATGLPRSPALAIKRGSVFRWKADTEVGRANLRQWRDALRQAQQEQAGLGERTADGFGRFVLDLNLHETTYWERLQPTAAAAPEPAEDNWRERVLALVKKFVEKPREEPEEKGWPRVSVSQWQWLRTQARLADAEEKLEDLHKELAAHAKRAGGKQWGGLPAALHRAEQEAGAAVPDRRLDARRYFLDALARRMTAEARAARAAEGERS
jgi:CRISPR/Cas system CSM-associated protein Csm3 (group 7 of RAMP superfamily)